MDFSAKNASAASLIDEKARRDFEAAWGSGRPEPIESFLPEQSSPEFLPTLLELAIIEIELAWRSHAGSGTIVEAYAFSPPRVEDYLRRFPVLNDPACVRELVVQEFHVRNRFGDRPPREEFERRFPGVLPGQAEISTVTGQDQRPSTLSVRLPDITGYEMIEILGRGGMGVVFKARQRSLNRLVAVKMILAGAQADDGDLARFRREAEAVAQLHHPNIVQIHEIGDKDGQPFFCLEFIDGGSLAHCLGHKPQPPRGAAALVATLARAMEYVHQRGIVHRDLKPANVLLQIGQSSDSERPRPSRSETSTVDLQSAIPKISDFGLAKRLEGSAGHTHTGAILGTPSYMAPEQAAGRTKDIGPPADIYALGAILYEMLTGRPPFQSDTPFEAVLKVVKDDPVRPRQLQPGIDRDLETICLKALAKEPAQRYASALGLANDLERFLAGESIEARREGMVARTWRKVKRRPVAYIGSLVGIVILLVAGTFFLLSQESQERAQLDRQITELQTSLAKEFDRDEWDQAHLARMESLISQLALLDPGQAQLAKEHALQRHKNFLESQLRLPRLSAETRDRINQSLKRLAEHDAESAKSLAIALKQRLRDWEPVFDLKAPYTELDEIFSGPLVKAKKNVLVVNPADPKKKDEKRDVARVLSKIPSSGNVRLEAVIEDFGDKASEVGLLLNVAQTHALWVRALAFSPDGRWLASAGDDATVLVWDVATGQAKWSFREPQGISSVAFHPDGVNLASAAGKSIRLRDLTSGKAVAHWEASSHAVSSIAYSPDGRLLASGGDDKTIKLWSTVDNSLKQEVANLPGPIGLVHMPDNRKVIAVTSGEKRTVRQWQLDAAGTPQEFVMRFKFGDNIAAVSPDGRLIAGSTWASWIECYEMPSGKFRNTFDVPYANMAFSPTGKYLAAGCCHLNNQPMPLVIYDIDTGRRVAVIAAHGRDIYRVAFSPDGTMLASASADGTIRLWNVPDFTLKRILGGQSYAFLLSTHDGQAINPGGTATAPSRPRGGQATDLRILVEGQELRRKEIQLPAGASSLQMRATRENNTLSFQINDLPPMVFEDLFSLPSLTLGVFGLQTNGQVEIGQLRAFRQAAAVERSPLEEGDLLAATGKHREALDFYQQQALVAGTSPVGREARCKAGLCLAHLGRHKESDEVFGQVFGQAAKDRWGQFAACQMLMIRLNQNRFDDPETEQLFEVLQPQASQVASLVPLATANRILGTYGISPFDYIFFKDSHLARLKRGVAAEQLFERPASVSLKVKIQLLHGYSLLGRDLEALAYAQKLFDEIKAAVLGKADPSHVQGLAIAECCWALRRLTDPQKLLLELDSLIAQHGRTDFARPLWLEKARTLGLLQRSAEADQVLAEFLKFPLPANERDYGTYAGACLLKGFLCEQKGEPDLALKYWKDGTVSSWTAKLHAPFPRLISINDTLSLHNQLILSSLANDLSDEVVQEILKRVTQGAHGGSPIQLALKSFPVPTGVLRELYRSPRGRAMARQIAFRDLSFAEYIRGTAHLAFYEYMRQKAMPVAQLSPEQDAVVWQAGRDLFDEYAAGNVDQFKLLQFGLAWQRGTTGAFGWAGFSAKLKPEFKANMAYVLGQRMRKVNKPKEANFFFQQCFKAAPTASTVRGLAESELQPEERVEKKK